jgi:hypothetical protein
MNYLDVLDLSARTGISSAGYVHGNPCGTRVSIVNDGTGGGIVGGFIAAGVYTY